MRERRGSGTQSKVQANAKVPTKWTDFLFVSENKEELFQFLAREIGKQSFDEDKQVLVTLDSKVLTINSPPMAPCSYEEADTRVFIHIIDAVEEGNNVSLIHTVDTDIVVICIGKFHAILARYPDFQLWVKFGTGSTQHMIYINSICEAIGQSVSHGMPFFHALTGCDTTSAFRNKDKKTGWNTWSGYQAITSFFEFLSHNPFPTIHPQLPDFDLLQKFVIRLYSKSTQIMA